MGKETLEKIDRLIEAESDSIRKMIESKNPMQTERIKALAELISARALVKKTDTSLTETIVINVKSNAVNLDDLLESTKNLKLNRNVMQSY